MATIIQQPLFSWQEIDACSDLERLHLVLSALPDEELMRQLEEQRGNGRDDYPVRVMWNTLVAGVVFQHPSIASLRRELLRNGELRQCCGYDPCRGILAVPAAHVFSRFLGSLQRHESLIRAMFDRLVDQLREVLPDLGVNLAVDGKAIHSAGKKSDRARDGRRDIDADWGTKSYRGQRADGTLFCAAGKSDDEPLIPLAYDGFEKRRGTLKYRCPAAVYGLDCPERTSCGAGPYGRVIRVPLELNRRRFIPLPRSSYKFKRLYKKRTAVERVNSRLDVSFGFERHFIRGQ